LIETYRPHIKESCFYSIMNFKVQQATIYHPINNDMKIVFAYNTSMKKLKISLIIPPKYYFDFATRENLFERENKETQCSGNASHIYIFIIILTTCVIFSDVIGLLTSMSTLQKIIVMKHNSNPRMKDNREIEILLLG
jgi:hypothetical protein